MNTSSINQAISPVSQCQLQQMCSKLSQHQLQWMYSSIQLQWMYSSTSPSGCVPPPVPVSSSNIQWSRLYLQFLSVNSSKCVLRQMFQSPAPMSNEPGHFFSSPSINSSGCIPAPAPVDVFHHLFQFPAQIFNDPGYISSFSVSTPANVF